MKKTTIRELKHAMPSVLAWVAEGQSVEVSRRGKPVAMLTPIKRKKAVVLPDFSARLQIVYGKLRLTRTGTETVSEGRGER